MQITQRSKKCRIRLIRSAIVKKASQDEQQNQKTIAKNINQFQNIPIHTSPEKVWDYCIKRFGNNKIKKNKKRQT